MAATLGEAHFYEESMNSTKVRNYLASSKEVEKSKGMKFLLANMSKGRDMSEFFPDVVKNVVVKAVEVKKMVYMYLVHYADATPQCRELALLSINSFQKDLAAANQLIRALALRVMTSIRVPDIIQIQLLAIYKCASDSSPYVRRCAATAVSKIYSLDLSQLPQLTQVLEKLLKDSSTMVLGSAVAAFNEVCPHQYELLHRSYRKLCHLLADMDEWTQISVMTVLTRYVKTQFTDPAPGARAAALACAQQRSSSASSAASHAQPMVKVKRRVVKKAFYSDEEDMSEEEEVEAMSGIHDMSSSAAAAAPNALFHRSADAELEAVDLDPDHKLLLRSSLPLLKSRNCGVVLSVCTLHYYCGTQADATAAQLGKSLVRVSRNRREIAFVVLKAIASMAQERPAMFRPFLPDFFVKASDPSFNRSLKLDILTALTDGTNVTTVLRELQTYVKHSDKDFVCATVRAVGRVADAQPEVCDRCLRGLLTLIVASRAEKVTGEAIVVVRQLLQQTPADRIEESVVKHMASLLTKEKGTKVPPPARASLIWIAGEFHAMLSGVAPDLLRILAQSFPDEAPEVKLQVLNFAVKLHLSRSKALSDDNLSKLVRYVLEMARFDSNYDIRDRTRLITASLGLAAGGQGTPQVDAAALVSLREKAEEVFLKPKLPPLTLLGPVAMDGRPNLTISSLSWMLNHKVQGYQDLPEWADMAADPSMRDAPTAARQASFDSAAGTQDVDAGGRRSQPQGAASEEESTEEFYSESDDEGTGSEASDGSGTEESAYSESGSEAEGSGGDESGSTRDEKGGRRQAANARAMGPQPTAKKPSPADDTDDTRSDGSDSDEDGSRSSGYSSSGYDSAEGSSGGAEADVSTGGGGRVQSLLGTPTRSAYDELIGGGGLTGGATTNKGSGAGGGGGGMGGGFPSPLAPLEPPGQQAPGSPDALLDLEAYATSKRTTASTKLGVGRSAEDLAAMLQGLDTSSHSINSNNSSGGGVGVGGSGRIIVGGSLSRGASNVGVVDMSSAGLGGVKPGVVYSVSRELLRHEMGGGLSVRYCFTREDRMGSVVILLLSLANMRDTPIRHIRMIPAADGPRLAQGFQEIAMVEAGATVEIRVALDVQDDSISSFRFTLVSDRGSYPVAVTLPAEELIRPHAVSQDEAEAVMRTLMGFHETRSTFALPVGLSSDDVPDKMLQSANLAQVTAADVYEETGVAVFYGVVRKVGRLGASERVVVKVSVDIVARKVALQVHCDDAMLSARLLDVLKRGIACKDVPRRM